MKKLVATRKASWKQHDFQIRSKQKSSRLGPSRKFRRIAFYLQLQDKRIQADKLFHNEKPHSKNNGFPSSCMSMWFRSSILPIGSTAADSRNHRPDRSTIHLPTVYWSHESNLKRVHLLWKAMHRTSLELYTPKWNYAWRLFQNLIASNAPRYSTVIDDELPSTEFPCMLYPSFWRLSGFQFQ